MRTRSLGKRGPEITTVGFGAWAIGGGGWKFGWGATDDNQSIAAVRHAVEQGINWVDTAAVYGLGHSEELVGRALEPFSVGEDVYVFTKCGRVWSGDGDEIKHDLRPESIRFECEQSLKRLGVERIDLYQFHWPDPVTGTPVEDSWATMSALIQEGKVRWAGVSNFDDVLLDRCEAVAHVDSVQPPLSMINRWARARVLKWCVENGAGVIVYSPMGSGLLTGVFDSERVAALPVNDWRRRAANFKEPQLSRTMALVARLEGVASRLDCSLAELAVAWALANEGVTAAIVGARRSDQVEGWIGASDLEIDAATLNEIEQAILETGAGSEDPPGPGASTRASSK
jgi:aryl-alcohol dehydrogenase-like predicted oxidoreductase